MRARAATHRIGQHLDLIVLNAYRLEHRAAKVGMRDRQYQHLELIAIGVERAKRT